MATTRIAAQGAAQDAANPRRWVVWLARAGYAARGLVYAVVGGLALTAAFGQGNAEGSRGALTSLMDEPGGMIALGFIAIGLIGYSLWRTIQAVFDADGHGTEAKGLVVRGGLLVSAITHLALAGFAGSLAFGWGFSGGGSGGSQEGAATLMALPGGPWWVGLVGAAIIGGGLAQIVKGWKAKFEKYLDMPQDQLDKVSPVCRFGLIGRGVVFVIVGGFFISAAVRYDPNQARGLEGALETLQGQPYGPWLLGIVALGLAAFGAYSLIEAVYRRVHPPRGSRLALPG